MIINSEFNSELNSELNSKLNSKLCWFPLQAGSGGVRKRIWLRRHFSATRLKNRHRQSGRDLDELEDLIERDLSGEGLWRTRQAKGFAERRHDEGRHWRKTQCRKIHWRKTQWRKIHWRKTHWRKIHWKKTRRKKTRWRHSKDVQCVCRCRTKWISTQGGSLGEKLSEWRGWASLIVNNYSIRITFAVISST